ncbi:AMP phosphorylase [Halorientalis sp. IM1011]|uniref:AMP phosphorylase n=1 Tax=Halorientalis sp. IM1011 TaxID=1932360 RepID=UPI00097CC213|nr:AMP phosphorylase [Halorientalis sp. IM1011]AQL42021.1 AMP phosphorylase [Halorientalis sp. IM1011]
MKLQAREIDIGTRTPTVLLNEGDAAEIGVHPLDRVEIEHDGRTVIGVVELTDELVDEGELAVTRPLGHIEGEVRVSIAPNPSSASFVRKKLDDIELEADEIEAIVTDIKYDRLTDAELSAFVTSVYTNGLSRAEIVDLTESMIAAGETMHWDGDPVADKHSIGGVAGNRVTPIVVSIVAAAGVTIPKTSSRAVTSAAGTADTVEVFCDVEFDIDEIREIVAETGGCMVWGGGVNLSPVDDKIIRVETPLSLDPPGQMIASVLSKKKSAGSTRVVIDIPYGEGAKVSSLDAAREMAEDFDRVGDALDMHVDCAITRGNQPVGTGIGCGLEARDVLAVLEGEGPEDLRQKSVSLAEMVLSACDCEDGAAQILDDGRALAKFREIVAAQDGDPDVTASDLPLGGHTATVEAPQAGLVGHANNRLVNETARRAGAPKDKGAGVDLAARVGDTVEEGAPLFTVYAETADKLDEAVQFARENHPLRVSGPDEALVERYT